MKNFNILQLLLLSCLQKTLTVQVNKVYTVNNLLISLYQFNKGFFFFTKTLHAHIQYLQYLIENKLILIRSYYIRLTYWNRQRGTIFRIDVQFLNCQLKIKFLLSFKENNALRNMFSRKQSAWFNNPYEKLQLT